MGRKRVEIDWKVLNSYLQLRTSKKACALLLDVSEDTIENRIKEEHGCTFTEYSEKQVAPVQLKLAQKAINLALGGNVTMLIFCLKNINCWSDKNEVVSVSDPSIKIDKHDEKL